MIPYQNESCITVTNSSLILLSYIIIIEENIVKEINNREMWWDI